MSQKSLKAYSIDLRQFISHFYKDEEQSFTKVGICSYISEFHKTYSPKTAKRKLSSMRGFFNHLEFEEIIDINPFRKIRTKFQEPKILPKTIPIEIIEKLITIAHKENTQAKTDYKKFTALRDTAVVGQVYHQSLQPNDY